MVKIYKTNKKPFQKEKEELKPVPIPKLDFIYDKQDDITDKDLFNKGKKLYEYQSKKSKKQLSTSDAKLMQQLTHSGTLSDKISALSLQIKDDPQYALIPLHKLFEIASRTKPREKSLKALFTIKDLFVHLLLKNGVPIHFDQGTGDEVERYYWHCIKYMLQSYLELVIQTGQDVIPYVRRQAIIMMIEVHASYPQLSQELVPELVNKFGDLDKNIVVLLTKRLATELSKKPALTYPFIKQIYGFMYRPNLQQQAQIYCINFLNSINLSAQESATLNYLMKVFFIFYKKLINVPNVETECPKLYSNILKGLNKTIPYGAQMIDQLRELYKENEKLIFTTIATTKNLKIRIQTIYLVYQIQQEHNDHYYRSLYELLLDQNIDNSKQCELLFDLLYLSIKEDKQIERQKAFIKRMLQIAMHSTLGFTITTLVCVHKLILENLQLLKNEEESEYDAFKREPLYANAKNLNELNAFLSHYNTRVVEITKSILEKNNKILQKVNPFLSYSTSAFLAKFAEAKNRTLKRISNMSKSVIDVEQYQARYKKQKKKDQEVKELNRPKKRVDDEEDEDEFADKLFEQELDKNDIDDDDDYDDLGSYGSDVESNSDKQKENGKQSYLMRKVIKKHRLLKGRL